MSIAIFHEFRDTLLASFSRDPASKNIDTLFFKRLDDVGATVTGGLFQLVSDTIWRCAYFLLSLLVSAFSLLDFVLHLMFISLTINAALLINLFYLFVNNLLVHVLTIGLMNNFFNAFLVFPFIFIDAAAQKRLSAHCKGFFYGLSSLFTLLGCLFSLTLFDLILGRQFLVLTDPEYVDNAYLSLQDSCNEENTACGIECYIPGAIYNASRLLCDKMFETIYGVVYFATTPIFIPLELAVFLALSFCSAVKLGMTIPLTLFSSATYALFPSEQETPKLIHQPLILSQQRAQHEEVYRQTNKPDS